MCQNHDVVAPKVVSLEGMHRRDIVRGLWGGTMLLGVAGTSGCASVGKLLEPSDEQLIPLAAEAWAQTKAETPISNDPKANARLQAVGKKISAIVPVQNAAWEFVVFDSKELNAFVLPGGKVGFYKGLIDFVDNDDQIAAVMGHEAGHVVARHAAKRAGRQQATQLGVALGGMAAGGVLSRDQQDAAMQIMTGIGVYGVILPFSRDNELQADKLGVDYMHQCGYDVKQSVRLWEKMGAASTNRPTEWMSTHPNPETRIAELRQYITSKGYATF
ncbi:MAG: M48 family metallopeptidase [Hyphomonadaceae bacterium]